MRVRLVVNGEAFDRDVEPRVLLSDFLRHGLGLTGTNVGCEHGVCGSCTILLDGEPVRSCTVLAVQAHGHRVTTVEGLGTSSDMHGLQRAFTARHGLQCGFCTPGILMTLVPVFNRGERLTQDEIREAISGNLCRCTGYQQIVESVQLALEEAVNLAEPTADNHVKLDRPQETASTKGKVGE